MIWLKSILLQMGCAENIVSALNEAFFSPLLFSNGQIRTCKAPSLQRLLNGLWTKPLFGQRFLFNGVYHTAIFAITAVLAVFPIL